LHYFLLLLRSVLAGWSAAKALEVVGNSLAPIAAVVFIVGAGGGFKQMLIAAKISDLVGVWATHANISPLLLGWGIAALVRIATGSGSLILSHVNDAGW
jgi:GntP family gluconate:H+ symporter